MIDLNIKLLQLRGNSFTYSFPLTEEERKKNETMTNVLLNCLSAYPVRQKKEIFLVNHIAQKIISAENGQLELPEDQRKLLVEIVLESTFQTEKDGGETKGVYTSALTGQVLKALGCEEEV